MSGVAYTNAYQQGILQYAPLWLFLLVMFYMDFRFIASLQTKIKSLLYAAHHLLSGEVQEKSSCGGVTCGSARGRGVGLASSSPFALHRLAGELGDFMSENYVFCVYRLGEDFQYVVRTHLQEYAMILHLLLGGYEFIKQALRSFCLVGCVLCFLSLSFGANHYDFTFMIVGFLVVHMLYFAYARSRLLHNFYLDFDTVYSKDSEEVMKKGKNAMLLSCFVRIRRRIRSWLFYRIVVEEMLRKFWIEKSSKEAIVHAEANSKTFVLSSKRFIYEDKLRQDFSLFQILQGVCVVVIFLLDNFHRLAQNYLS